VRVSRGLDSFLPSAVSNYVAGRFVRKWPQCYGVALYVSHETGGETVLRTPYSGKTYTCDKLCIARLVGKKGRGILIFLTSVES
jgi:hypothetical protein